jgi:hypothetical protein
MSSVSMGFAVGQTVYTVTVIEADKGMRSFVDHLFEWDSDSCKSHALRQSSDCTCAGMTRWEEGGNRGDAEGSGRNAGGWQPRSPVIQGDKL